MKSNTVVLSIAFVAGTLWAFAASPADDLMAAARKLADQPNYSWTQTTEMGGGGGGGRGPGPVEGKIEKGGFAFLTMTRGENTTQSIIKGEKGAIKLENEWKSVSEASDAGAGGGGWNPGRAFARTVKTFKAPAAQAEYLAGKVKELKKTDSGYSGEMTEEGAKEFLTFGGRGGGQAPEVSGAKGSTSFWLKDGQLVKYSFQVHGTVSMNGNEREIDRTTTVEIKNVGTTKVEIPEAAVKKAS